MNTNNIKVGTVEGTGAALNVECGFIPSYVKLFNHDDAGKLFASLEWFKGMPAGSGLKHNSGTRCLSAAGLAIGTSSKAKLLIANTVIYVLAGAYKSKTTAEVAFTATTHDIAANASSVQEAVFLLSLDASGTATITKGTTATGAGNAVVPATPANNVAIGHARIAVDAGATPFDASTDELDASHLTVTYTDIYSLGDSTELLSSSGISEFAGSLAGAQLTGTIAATQGSATLAGTNTLFLTELADDDIVKLSDGQELTVSAIASATSLTASAAATDSVATTPSTRISGKKEGFTLGAEADLNVSGETIYYIAVR